MQPISLAAALLSPTRAWVTKRRRKIFWLSFFKLERSDTSRRPSSPQFTLPLVTKKKPSVGWNGPLPSTRERPVPAKDRKSTRLNSSHITISYAVFCLKKKKKINKSNRHTQHTRNK